MHKSRQTTKTIPIRAWTNAGILFLFPPPQAGETNQNRCALSTPSNQRNREWGTVSMYRVAVLEPALGKFTSRLQDFLVQKTDIRAAVTAETELAAFSGAYDLFIALAADGSSAPSPGLRCRALLVPGDEQIEGVLRIPSQWVVSFGLSGKDSITLSSIEPDASVLALQRELVTLDGRVIERQEIPLPIPPATGAAGLMPMYGALLLMGVRPETLVV